LRIRGFSAVLQPQRAQRPEHPSWKTAMACALLPFNTMYRDKFFQDSMLSDNRQFMPSFADPV